MKINRFRYILLSLVPMFMLFSCLGNDNNEQKLPNEAYFVSLKFAKNDSIPKLETAVFSVYYDELSGDSIIVNLDSLPFQTRIDSVFPTFVFASTSAAFLVYKDVSGNDSLYALYEKDKKDTIDFTVPLLVRNTSLDKSKTEEYVIKVNVHQVEPELYVWKQLQKNINNNSASNQHAIRFNNSVFYYLSTGVNNYLYTAPSDCSDWTTRSGALTGLPAASIELRHMQLFNNTLYLFSDENKVYSSSDGENWNGADFPLAGYTTVELLFVFLDKMWGIVQETGTQKYYIAHTEDGVEWTVDNEIAANFPIEQYATLSFKTRLGVPKAIVVGGIAADGSYPFVWGVERSGNGVKWADFTQKGKEYESITGASIISYDNKLVMFHGTSTYMTQSINEGFSWTAMDTTYTKLPDEYYLRSYQSVFVDEADKRIFIIGGKNNFHVFSDVWTGKLNRLYWE